MLLCNVFGGKFTAVNRNDLCCHSRLSLRLDLLYPNVWHQMQAWLGGFGYKLSLASLGCKRTLSDCSAQVITLKNQNGPPYTYTTAGTSFFSLHLFGSTEGHPTWDSIWVYGLGWAVTLRDLELALFVNNKQNDTSFLQMLKLPSYIPERV